MDHGVVAGRTRVHGNPAMIERDARLLFVEGRPIDVDQLRVAAG